MEKNIFKLDNEQLKAIARSFKEKVEKGLNTENAEIQCIPTFITPKADNINGKSLVLDLGGTNYRVALVDFSKSVPDIHPNNGWKKDMSIMKSLGYTQEELFKELADMITGIKREEEMPIGYCFSYPTESVPGGDAKLLRWTKGVDIKEMIGKYIGNPLLNYLNEKNKIKFTDIKVLNDTVASLFAGLTDNSYDAYIGLIVGTGPNMATFTPADKIKKLNPADNIQGMIPVNLESGNFHPPFLTGVDNTVDVISGNPRKQRFEKAVSGMYLGDILKATFPLEEFEEKFEERNLKMVVHFDEEEAIICADGRRLWRVLENVFGNVSKYAMENTRVYVDVKVERPNVQLSLKNISAQPLNISADELTERFIRGDVSRNTEGSGLGLSIAKDLVQLQGGEFKLYLDGDLFKVTIEFEVK